MDESVHEECGIFGAIGNDFATELCILGLHALQHRGQEAFGIVTVESGTFFHYHYEGCVNNKIGSDVFKKATSAIGHVRYATSGVMNLKQPIYAKLHIGEIAVAHNGNLTNAEEIRAGLIKMGSIFQSDVDSEVFIHLIALANGETLLEKIQKSLHAINGAYSLIILSASHLIGIRDRFGIRPMVLGRIGDSYILASETCALDVVGAKFVRDILPGEMITVDQNNNVESFFIFERVQSRFCMFEYIYFARPDSNVGGRNVYEIRKKIGEILAKESPVENVDFVVAVPDSGIPAAMGYANTLNIPFEFGIVRNHYVGRTFIEPTEYTRNLGVKLKHNPNQYLLKGKNIVLIDDSIVRGTTIKKLIIILKECGVNEIHVRIASPEVKNPCFYGIDTPSKEGLISANCAKDEICKMLLVESVDFISVDGVYQAIIGETRDNNGPKFCDACFTGDYPM